MISPPCQPFTTTTNSQRRDMQDPRNSSFLHVLQTLSQMRNPPDHIILENVVGFQESQTHQLLLAVLQHLGYAVQQYVSSPIDLGVPYIRPRYFATASLRDATTLSPWRGKVSSPAVSCSSLPPSGIPEGAPGPGVAGSSSSRPLASDFLGPDAHSDAAGAPPVLLLQDFLEAPAAADAPAAAAASSSVPPRVLQKYAKVMDVVTPRSARCNCFTKHYTKNAWGAGSVLGTQEFVDRFCEIDDRGRIHITRSPTLDFHQNMLHHIPGLAPQLLTQEGSMHSSCSDSSAPAETSVADRGNVSVDSGSGVRYFTPREVANLHGLPRESCFPDDVSLKQRYKLLGNSLSVDCVVPLLQSMLLRQSP